MEHVLADQRLRISRLNDAGRFGEIEEAILCDDRNGRAGRALHPWRGWLSLSDQDVIVLATGHDDERLLGLVAASLRATRHEPFLLLEAACVPSPSPDRHLLSRMIAFAILSLVRSDLTPTLIAACCRSDVCAREIRALRTYFTAAVAFPDPDVPAIDLAMAGAAQRIARSVRPDARYAAGSGTFFAPSDRDGRVPQNTLVVLDLAASDEATIAADACRVFRRRSRRCPVYAADAAGDGRGTRRPVPGFTGGRSAARISRPLT